MGFILLCTVLSNSFAERLDVPCAELFLHQGNYLGASGKHSCLEAGRPLVSPSWCLGRTVPSGRAGRAGPSRPAVRNTSSPAMDRAAGGGHSASWLEAAASFICSKHCSRPLLCLERGQVTS